MDFLSMMKFAGSDDASSLGKKAVSFTEETVTLLREIRDEQKRSNKYLLHIAMANGYQPKEGEDYGR